MNHNTTNSKECSRLPKDEMNHDDSNDNNNTISHDDTCVLKEDFNSYPIKLNA